MHINGLQAHRSLAARYTQIGREFLKFLLHKYIMTGTGVKKKLLPFVPCSISESIYFVSLHKSYRSAILASSPLDDHMFPSIRPPYRSVCLSPEFGIKT